MELLYGLVAGGAAVMLEWRYTTTSAGYFSWHVLPWVICLQPVISYGIYGLVKSNENLVAALVAFSFATLTCRMSVTLLLHQPIYKGTWAAFVGLVLLQFIKRWK